MISSNGHNRRLHHAQQPASSRTPMGPATIVPHTFSEHVLALKHTSTSRGTHYSNHRYSRSMNSIPIVHVTAATPENDHASTSRAAKLLPFMRRTLSYKRAQRQSYERGMFSTPEEGFIPAPVSLSDSVSASSSPSSSSDRINEHSYHNSFHSEAPTVRQIAMGLHTSRTPHLRAAATTNNAQPRHRLGSDSGSCSPRKAPKSSKPSLVLKSNSASSSSSRLAQPLRSSMKKTSASVSSSPHPSRSTSPSTSTSLSTPKPSTPQSALGRLSLSISASASRTKVGRLLFSSSAFSRSASASQQSSQLSSQNSSLEEIIPPRKSVRFEAIAEDEVDLDIGMVVQKPRNGVIATGTSKRSAVVVVEPETVLPP